MRNIRIVIEYDGTNYQGWQKQKKGKTIQGELEAALMDLTKEPVEVIGSSRTDSGVHARGFVANFKTSSMIPSEKFRPALNVRLPEDIVIIHSEDVPEEFHARYHSLGKTYSYNIVNRDYPIALNRNYSIQIRDKLNIEDMQRACKYFEGKHDFEAFKSNGSSVKTSVRTIYELRLEKVGDLITFTVTGDGFLYNMVRIIVGTLLDVGRGRKKPEDIENIIKSRDRRKASICVPANGLVLEKVFYDKI